MSGASPSPDFSVELIALLPRLRRYARLLTGGDRAAADDLVQDTLERAWARHAQWRRGTDLRAWLFSIMHNRRVDLARADRFVALDDDAAVPVDDGPLPADSPIEPIDLQRAFERLGPDDRQVLALVAVEQLSYEETAKALAVPIGTVMSRLSRARQRLRTALADTGPAVRLTRVK
jgi:RNA polymerase sigma-70 factor (ECF subfamily)